jgi:hypothetical protein
MSLVVRESKLPGGFGFWVVVSEIEEVENELINAGQTGSSSKIGGELFNMGLSCGATVFAGLAAATSAAAVPFSFGASGMVTVLTAAAALASAAQCGISAGRVINELYSPGLNEQYLDSETWYNVTANTLDVISLAGGIAGLGQTGQAVLRLQASSKKTLKEIIRGLNRAERKKLAQDIALYTNQAQTRKQFIRLAKEGRIPKIFRRHEINDLLVHHLLNSIGTAFSFAGSSVNGVTRSMVVHFAEENG